MNEKKNPATLFQDSHPVPSFQRLVVLVPNADLDEIRLARRIRSMMSPYKAGILLLSPVRREEDASQERRRLTNLLAILHDPVYSVTSKMLSGSRWMEQIQQFLLPGDLLVCLSSQMAPTRGFKKESIGEALARQLSYPVYVLNDIPVKEVHKQALVHEILGWLVPVVMIVLFMGFDVRIAQNAVGWISTLLLLIVLVVEAGLIWGWNNIWS